MAGSNPFGDPQVMALLGLGQGLLAAGGPHSMPVGFGGALAQGLGGANAGYTQAMQNNAFAQNMEATNQKRDAIANFAKTLPQDQQAAFLAAPEAFMKERFGGYTLGPGQQRIVNGQPVASVPQAPSLVQVPVPGQPGVTQPTWLTPGQTQGQAVGGPAMPAILNTDVQNARVKVAEASRPVTNVNVSTEKKYGEQFAGKIAAADSDMRDAALKAPDLAERANSVRSIIGSGKVITGTGADYRLALGKALNLVGGTDAETIANTEALTVDMARNTLDAIKQSGLGSGTGFSNADRDFLEKAAGGKITLEAPTIDRLAQLAHKAASKTAEKWNTRVQEIPEDALKGTGINRDAIKVPALLGAKKVPSKGEIVDGWEFIGGDPGNRMNWKKK